MWTLIHPLDIRRITETIQDILWLLRYPKMTSVGHPWDKVCCVGTVPLEWRSNGHGLIIHQLLTALNSGKLLGTDCCEWAFAPCPNKPLPLDIKSLGAFKLAKQLACSPSNLMWLVGFISKNQSYSIARQTG